MNLLVVDDEELIRNVIKEYTSNEGYNVFEASDGNEAIKCVEKNNIDLIIMDVMMPNLDGFSACKEIKKIKDIPIIMLSARNEEYDKLNGFNLGVDDYITKPFSPKELLARIKAVSKRNNVGDNYIYEDLVIDYKGHTVKIDEKELKLTPKEYELLCYFVNNNNIALSREQLLSTLWGYDFFGDDRTIDTHIKMLRNNLGKYRDLIVTVRGLGYKFEIKK
ncbi:MAG: response regulator transcription factor [Bacilli bacterium]|nr:response regulator transcription factor [Bacilli bacterium]